MNLELSLPLLWLILFDVVSFIALIRLAVNRTKEKQGTCRLNVSFKKLSATNGERAKQGVPITTGDDEAGFVKTHTVGALAGISDRRFFLFSLFPFFATLSIFWSPNPVRAVLTAGIIWLIFFTVFALIFILPLLKLPANFRQGCLLSFLITSAIICLICWLQSCLDIAGISRETTLLCRGCTYLSFGFPHPSGFAIEPQFMGNLLLAPTLTALYLLIFKSSGGKENHINKTKLFAFSGISATDEERTKCRAARNDGPAQTGPEKRSFALLALAILFSSTLFLTFSRGAIYAYAIALIILICFALRRHRFRARLVIIPLATFFLVIVIQGFFTIIGPTHGSFLEGVSKSIHQLSLGIVDIRPKSTPETVGSTSENASDSPAAALEPSSNSAPSSDQALAETPASEPNNSQKQPVFDGYVAESTNARLNFNSVALRAWARDPLTILFGVGLGGAGTAMYQFDPGRIGSPKEIVQHQGISLLLELGLIGIALAIFGLLIAFFPQLFSRHFLDGKAAGNHPGMTFWQHPALPLLLSLIVAYLITLNFFSGLPNALQIYLMPPLLYMIFQKNPCVS